MRAQLRMGLSVALLFACQSDEDTWVRSQRDRSAIAEPGLSAAEVEASPAGAPGSMSPPSGAWPKPVAAGGQSPGPAGRDKSRAASPKRRPDARR